MIWYFAYGSNMHRDMIRARSRQAQPVGIASLHDFRFIITTEGYASIVRWPGATVHGVLWRLIPRDVAALNIYENLASGLYARDKVVVSRDGRRVPSLVYVTRSRTAGRQKPGYVATVLSAARDWKLPAQYIEEIARWSGTRANAAPALPSESLQ